MTSSTEAANDIQWADGKRDGKAWARSTGTTEASISMVPAVKGSKIYQSAFRLGAGNVRIERRLTERASANPQPCVFERDATDPAIRVCVTHDPALGLYDDEECAGGK